LDFDSENLQAEETSDIHGNVGRGTGHDHGAFGLGLLFVAIGDLIGEGLAGSQVRKQVKAIA
jgi:hypothetical protein